MKFGKNELIASTDNIKMPFSLPSHIRVLIYTE